MRKSALLIIDVQKGFDEPGWGSRNNLDAESNISLLLNEWRKQNFPIIHVQHCSVEPHSPLRPELPGNAFKDEVKPLPGEKQFTKSVNSAFIGTGLEEYLHNKAIEALVIVGLTTDHCVSTSVRMAANLGFEVVVVADATATFERIGHDGKQYSAEQIHDVTLVSLNKEFCQIMTTKEVVSWISGHPGMEVNA